MRYTYQTAESVSAGHPDKICDYIADSILDECLIQDPESRVACEVLATSNTIIVAGEITTKAIVNCKDTVQVALHDIGYEKSRIKKFNIENLTRTQSPDISQAVGNSAGFLGAGDQGIVYGYATNENEYMLPTASLLAHKILRRLKSYDISDLGLGLDAKCQVTVKYIEDIPFAVTDVVLSCQHGENENLDSLRTYLCQNAIKPVVPSIDDNTNIRINPSGRFVLGGLDADTGLTGRKLMVDTYGGMYPHGGGAFSGKDPTKLDRSGAYMARYVAKNIVAARLSTRCQVSIAYAIGEASPVMVDVNTFGTNTIYSDSKLAKLVSSYFDLTPNGIINTLNLKRPIYRDTTNYGHFTKKFLPWECINHDFLETCGIPKLL